MTFGVFFEAIEKTEFETELVIGGVDMPATFCWDGDTMALTDYCKEKYKKLFDADCSVHTNFIEVFCDDWKIGEGFVYAAAGHVGCEEYNRLFTKTH